MTRHVFTALLIGSLILSRGAAAAPITLTTTGQFQVQWKGAIEPGARIFRSSAPPTVLLVTTAAFSRPIYITIGPTSARLIDSARVVPDPANPEIVRVDPSGPVENLLGLRPDGANLTLDRDGISITLVPSPPVLGDRTLDELVQALPDYRRDAAAYTPQGATVDKLRQLEQPAELVVYFGSWCSHCAQLVPKMIRILQDAKAPQLRVRFHGLPPNGERDPEADAERIDALPTAIVRRGGKEIGRMVEAAWDTPESSLLNLLTTKPAP
jgi:thiol-disulfide isomerase/thioredoxin